MARNPTPKPNESGAERAARLREQIARLKEDRPDRAGDPHPTDENLSDHERVQRRMRELDRKKK